ncbi:phospholipid-translocating P-type ATPase [Thamnocephalis sphaerospora]|uniref:Phospholipid-transporting ATPase n=1 Tax=Thamnocephalis sphaerospora TaxID=78915 RepID=A0A4P9XUZ9_9FUNG|nr:phospholipid-translocating P-type ATPase [Thamnocephalis sphaerospora]|eukprot:RKP10075.1 phospholipid-translocating P-type ATPase [Thamnocephalis sphaerospora]
MDALEDDNNAGESYQLHETRRGHRDSSGAGLDATADSQPALNPRDSVQQDAIGDSTMGKARVSDDEESMAPLMARSRRGRQHVGRLSIDEEDALETSPTRKRRNAFGRDDEDSGTIGDFSMGPSLSDRPLMRPSKYGCNKDGSRVVPLRAEDRPKKQRYPPNLVQNQKYNAITFIPVVLYEQFKFFFNLYFLLVALSQFVPELQIGYIITYIGPLCFVLMVTMAKEASDDLARRRRDREANAQRYQLLTEDGDWREVTAAEISVGDLVVIRKDQRVPADMILLRTTEQDGTCFLRTDQLDGETDWKLRIAVPSCQKLPNDAALVHLEAYVNADPPQKDIHSFVGTFTRVSHGSPLGSPPVEPLGVENTLWASTVLAAGSVVGLVVYTGRETRSVMNTNQPGTKVGLIDWEINRLSKILCLVTFLMSLLLIALNGFRGTWYVYLVRFLILFSSIIPISLRVNLDMGKTVYSSLIMRDQDIPDTLVRTSTIPEELGRVEYLLSDKTGTLTKNDMELKKLHMGTMAFAMDSMDEVSSHLAEAYRRDGTEMATRARRDMSARVRDVALALALCHNVTPIESDDGSVTYQAASPDEVAIVRWTAAVGLRLAARDLRSITLEAPDGHQHVYEVLDIFPFTSETKRMGIIVREMATGELIFFEKGADAVMARIVQYNDWLDEECGNMAREGLRTLVVARKRMSEEEYQAFAERHNAAKVSLHDRAGAIRSVIENELERDLELLGLTGVEDRLQDDVKSTLELLRNAGLKIWMLTGDKIETATCIAISSRLVSRNQAIHQISRVRSVHEIQEELEAVRNKRDCCMVIDGESLQLCLDTCRDEFISIAVKLPAVVCCRCSPTQKADITRIIKRHTGKRVCAIGDGGNDVSMIQTAHVGVGIVGKEGRQASLAADFSITQFSHLTKLLYKRSAKLSQFVIHRGLIISVMQAVFSSIFYFAPIALYQGALIVGYSTVFTMAPVFSLVLDRDVNEEIALLYPELYKELRKGRSLSFKTFFSWLLISLYQGGAIMMLAIWLFRDDFMNIVSISFTALVLNELLMVAFEINTWHRYMLYAELATLLIYISSMSFLDVDFDMAFILTWAFVWRVLVITAVSSLPLYVVKRVRRMFAPPSYAKLT